MARYFGGALNDTIEDVLGQADTMFGAAGDDLLYGGADGTSGGDRDTLFGGSGNDTAHGGAGADWVLGETGADLLFGGYGQDTIDAGADDDRAWGGDGNDTVFGGDGSDARQQERELLHFVSPSPGWPSSKSLTGRSRGLLMSYISAPSIQTCCGRV